MKILGIHIGHDSGASLVVDGTVVADVAEERFTRIKHYAGIPIQSIEYCLSEGKISFEDIDHIAIPSLQQSPSLYFLFENLPKKISLNKKIRNFLQAKFKKIHSHPSLIPPQQKPPLYIKKFTLSPKTTITYIEHHAAHAASAYYTSGSSGKKLIVTIDGIGDECSIGLWRGEKNQITPLKKFSADASLGWFYSNVTEALGWWHGDGEGKTMGLAPYGKTDEVSGLLEGFHPKFSEGRLISPHDFGPYYTYNENGAVQFHFDEAYEIKKLIDIYGSANIAAEAQKILEDQVMNIILPWLNIERTSNLCCAGGVFLNVKLNQRIWYSGKVSEQHIFPNPGDGGLSLGAALYLYHKLVRDQPLLKLDHIYWGPQFTNDTLRRILQNRNIPFVSDENIAKTCAKLLSEGKIIGWFQGRMESGPRSLGSRSILMSPTSAENKDIINAKVKFREGFRPFCPSMLAEERDTYLSNARLEEFMITSFDAEPNHMDKIPAVVHVDGTVRPQMVKRETNPKFYDLIRYFGDITGIPVLLNSSFNVRGEPIVCSPSDAIKCFYDTGLDYLAIGDYLVRK